MNIQTEFKKRIRLCKIFHLNINVSAFVGCAIKRCAEMANAMDLSNSTKSFFIISVIKMEIRGSILISTWL